ARPPGGFRTREQRLCFRRRTALMQTFEPAWNIRGSGQMWTLTPDDIRRAKDELIQRRSAAEAQHAEELRVHEARHAEELKTVDAELAEVSGLEQEVDKLGRNEHPGHAYKHTQ